MTWQFTANAKRVRRYLYEQFLAEGRSPNVARIMEATALAKAQVDEALRELERGVMVMLERDTDGVVVKCPPWANIPTPHLIGVDGRRKWYAGCAFEALNICYCHPGKLVTIDSSCPHCGEPVQITLRDDDVVSHAPGETVVHIGIDPRRWKENWVAACANTNFFPSAGHVRAYEQARRVRGASVPLLQARELTRYKNRLDYERGADGGGEGMLPALRKIGAAPNEWGGG